MPVRRTGRMGDEAGLGVLLIGAVALACLASQPVAAQLSQVMSDQLPSDEKGLFPHIFNLATRGRISVNATCGERGPETYCKLVEHVPNESSDYPQCRLCNARSASEGQRHSIWNAIDGRESWWQSPSIANGMQYHWVTITLDLGQIYQVAYVIVKAANSPRPGNWILERSLDGEMYKPWQYFAISESECVKRYGLYPSKSMHHFERDDEVSCTALYSKLEPMENGEIHTSIINGRPTASNPSPVLLEFTSARFIRLRLQHIRTLNADLMTFNARGISYVDPIVSRRYYYSIKDISVGGQCICFGHAEQCVLDPEAGPNDLALKCICEHNTCGDQCNECCPGYHQQPWRPGNVDFGNSCQACNCHGHADDCYYDPKVDAESRSMDTLGNYNGGGVCMSCRDNTAGVNCETCRDGYYRPLGVEPSDSFPCRECNCSPIGTRPESNNNCMKDESQQVDSMNPGDCDCREGYAGPSCDRCARGYRGYPDCERCECSDAGSLNEDPCEGPCVCKPNVEGSYCNVCSRGFFNLNGENEEGCEQCFCFGITTECYSVPWPVQEVTTLSGWFVTTVQRSSYAFPDTTGLDMLAISHRKAQEDLGQDNYYWFASTEYLGNKLGSHGGYLTFTVSYSTHRGDYLHEPTRGIDVVIEGDRLRLYQSFLYLRPEEQRTARVRMTSGDWFVLTSEVDASSGVMGRRATQAEFMAVLANVRMLLIRASFNTRPRESRLKNVRLEEVNRQAEASSILASVEQCACPPTYEGLSCESCEYGYRRVNNALIDGQCMKCDCNDHSPDCDAYTGECMQCDHNTYGPHCEFCLPGYYGDATSGLPDACRPCACPREEQGLSFSPSCVADARFGFVCDQCTTGHTGLRCERCADGYFGDPMSTGMACKPCAINCNGNLDNTSPGSCDTTTGACVRCTTGTAGDNCEKCAVGYYGDAMQRNCQACGCHEGGSTSPQCNDITGSCDCTANVTGRQCDTCMPGHYNLTAEGCESCDCHPDGSLDSACDVMTGQCRCKPGVSGRRCNHCEAGHWNLGPRGCQSCECEQSGGQCDPLTGQCGCPASVIGQRCDSCAPGTWGYDPMAGCKPCNCSDIGSTGQTCDVVTGQCRCARSYVGRRCDQCAFGYHDYPKCKKCRCSRRGRDPASCKGDLCDCDDEGNCFCKANIQGKKCNRCARGSFSLQTRLPEGCTGCFCFGASEKCDQADYIVSRIEMTMDDASQLTVSDAHMLSRTQTGVTLYSLGGGVNITAAQTALRTREVYWNLPPRFLGNKVTAYGGMIKYKIDYQEPKSADGISSDLRPYLPHIMIVGEEHAVQIPVGKLNGKARPKLEFFEHNFVHQGTGDTPTREEFMMVLQDVQAILIPATMTHRTLSSRISSVYMEVGVARGNDTTSPSVLGLEECRCPKGYKGTSCEECMAGYVRVKEGPYLGRCVQCTCHKHAEECDEGTGRCKDCQHNTTGAQCELCAPHFYGDATRGRSNACQPCGCPLQILSNNFSPACELASDGGYICTACPRGYIGRYCERCADGYFGNPVIPGSRCHPCGCNEYGSNSTVCDSSTGQCHCIEGVTGQRCDECGPRHVVVQEGCKSCDDGCTGPLFDALDEMKEDIDRLNITRFIPPPWMSLQEIMDQRNELQAEVDSYKRAVIAANELIASLPNGTNGLSAMARRLNRRLDKAAPGMEILAANASDVSLRARELLDYAAVTQHLINETVAQLQALFESLGLQPVMDNLELLKRSRRILQELRGRDFKETEEEALEELRLANETLLRTDDGLAALLQELYDRIAKDGDRLKELILNLDDLEILCRVTTKNTQNANEIIQSANQTCSAIQNITDIVEEKERASQSELNEAADLLDAAEDLLGMANYSLQVTQAERTNLTEVLLDLVLRADITDRDLSELTDEVDAAVEHAMELHNSSVVLENLLAPTQRHAQRSLDAVNAYSDMVVAINEAHNASLQAWDAADQAHQEVFSTSEDSLSERAQKLKMDGLNQLRMTNALDGDLLSLTSDLADLKVELNEVGVMQDEVTQGLEEIKRSLPPLEQGIATDAQQAVHIAMAAGGVAGVARNKSLDMSRRAGRIKERIDGLDEKYEDFINMTDDITDSVEESVRVVDEMGMKMNDLKQHAMALGQREAPMEASLEQLREKIRHARTEASRINVALKSEGDCVRTYKAKASSSAFNTLILHVNVSGPDNLLFYIGSNITGDFLAVETVEGQVRLRWDLGSGIGEITHPTNLSANPDWYRIDIQRFALTTSLKVENSAQAMIANGTTVTGYSPEDKTILDVREDSDFFIAGIPPQYDIPQVSTKAFNGTIGEVIFDDVTIGLWNTKSISGTCQGSFRSPITISLEPGAYFDGTGYAALPQPTHWNGNINSLNFDIKTLAENALLFFSASEDQTSFLSIEMEAGRLAIKHDLGDGIGILVSESKINDGAWHAVGINRVAQMNNLFINSASEGMSKSPGEAVNLGVPAVSNVYVGGVPSDLTIYRNVTSQKFRGCLRKFYLFRSTYPLVNPGTSFGVTHGCIEQTERQLGLSGFGYVSFRPIPLGREADLSVTFRTLMPNATILAAGEQQGRRRRDVDPDATEISYALGLIDGRIIVQINNGQGRLTLKTKRSDMPYNNGSAHAVVITKKDKRVTLIVNDRRADTGRLSGTEVFIPAMSPFYVGSSGNLTLSPEFSSLPRFSGCIENLIVMKELMGFDKATNFENATIGSCGPLTIPPPTIPATPIPPDELETLCYTPSPPAMSSKAGRFGSVAGSHVALKVNPEEVAKVFEITIELKTTQNESLVFYMGDDAGRYAVLQVVSGFVFFHFKIGNVPVLIDSDFVIDDGYWHTIKISRNRKTGSLEIDGTKKKRKKSDNGRKTLNIREPIFIGGLPLNHRATGSFGANFNGCIRKFLLNNIDVDLTGSTNNSYGVVTCYTNTEPGHYFQGIGHALLANQQQIGANFELLTEFRTAQKDGLLFAATDLDGVGISLELQNHDIILKLITGTRMASIPFIAHDNFTVCDYAWHLIEVVERDGLWKLSVDGVAANNLRGTVRLPADERYQFYAGGNPLSNPEAQRFKGCIRRLEINGRLFPIESSVDIVGVVPLECPIV